MLKDWAGSWACLAVRQIRLQWHCARMADMVTWRELVPTPFRIDPIFWVVVLLLLS